jgi:hypothetical protein
MQFYTGSENQNFMSKTKLHGLSPRANYEYIDLATALVGEVIANFCG